MPPPRARTRRRSPLWARLCLLFGALLVVASGSVVIGARVLVTAANRSVTQQNLLGGAGTQAREQHVTVTGAKTILLVGLDNRPGQDPTALVRADSIMLLHVAAGHDRAYLVSVPRDTYVRVPGFGVQKINAAFAFGHRNGGGIAGGVQLLARTIESITGIVPDAAAVIDFSGFQQLVGVLGGVDLCVDEKTTSIHIGFTASGQRRAPFHINSDGTVGRRVPGVQPVVYQKGCQHLAAWQALDYVRQRDLLELHDLDYGRQRHQQQFIRAVFTKLLHTGTLTDVTKLGSILAATRRTMTIDSGGIPPADWLYAMRAITPGSLITVKTNAGRLNPKVIGGIDYELLSPLSMELLRAVNDDTVDAFVAAHPDWVSTPT
ncbi:MAG TPA: LCP family protein [Rugosimonospora sp.]|nr:LCP family protein [Rugosimonospora sp.]